MACWQDCLPFSLAVFDPVGAGNRRLLAMLLLCDPKGNRQRGVPIDKMSILVTVLFSHIVFKEKLSRRAAIGLGFMLIGTVIMAVWG